MKTHYSYNHHYSTAENAMVMSFHRVFRRLILANLRSVLFIGFISCCINSFSLSAQNDSAYQFVQTYINPVLPADHPDLTLLKVGKDFYCCGSSFHFTPYLPILHSTDLVHWETICRVVPAGWSALQSSAPSAGIWQGAITYFYGSFWIYYSNTAGGGQYFSKASSPSGPWSAPVKMTGTTDTGASGYDNSVFVDDDGTPYLLIKPSQKVNRIQKIGTNGHLTDKVINLDWINAKAQYSYAEGPVMCKRNGWYYYFVAKNVGGGQFVLRTQTLTADSTAWQRLGSFYPSVVAPLGAPNHISQPFQLDDGTWWTLSHSYESTWGGSDWSGQGRQGLLQQINWDANGKPTGVAAVTTPLLVPRLPASGVAWKLPRSDYFDGSTINLSWYFLNPKAATQYSLSAKKGWLTINPVGGRSHILQKAGGHFYTLVTRVNFVPTAVGQHAGIYLTNGNESLNVRLCTNFSGGKKITFACDSLKVKYEVDNAIGDSVWLKVDRKDHSLTGFYSADGLNWTQVGSAMNVTALDKSQSSYNWWVGNSIGLYAEGKSADFDHFLYKDGFSALPLIGYNNYYGIETVGNAVGTVITNSTNKGGWTMLGGVDLGQDDFSSGKVEIVAASVANGSVEIWADDLGNNGKLLATIPIASTGNVNTWQTFTATIEKMGGQHDIFVKFNGPAKALLVNTIRFVPQRSTNSAVSALSANETISAYPNPFSESFTISTEMENAAYSVYDIAGKMISTDKFPTRVTLQIGQDFLPGVYFVYVKSQRKTSVLKMVKKNDF